jgi:hypothetical protein
VGSGLWKASVAVFADCECDEWCQVTDHAQTLAILERSVGFVHHFDRKGKKFVIRRLLDSGFCGLVTYSQQHENLLMAE